MKYEYWYNWEYAKEHNPSLMHIGRTGGFGLTRSNMVEYVAVRERKKAERCFWKLVQETNWEWQKDLEFDMTLFEQEQDKWFLEVMEGERKYDLWDEIRHFIRPKDTIPLDLSGGPDWERGFSKSNRSDNPDEPVPMQQQPYSGPLKRRYPVGIMRDTPMDLNPDPMVVPTMATFKEWGNAESYAQDLRAFIEYVHDNDAMDPLDPAVIY